MVNQNHSSALLEMRRKAMSLEQIENTSQSIRGRKGQKFVQALLVPEKGRKIIPVPVPILRTFGGSSIPALDCDIEAWIPMDDDMNLWATPLNFCRRVSVPRVGDEEVEDLFFLLFWVPQPAREGCDEEKKPHLDQNEFVTALINPLIHSGYLCWYGPVLVMGLNSSNELVPLSDPNSPPVFRAIANVFSYLAANPDDDRPNPGTPDSDAPLNWSTS